MDLSKWNPFKFVRNKLGKKEGGEASSQPQAELAPAPRVQPTQPMAPVFQTPSLFQPSAFPWSLASWTPSFAENGWFGDFSPSIFRPSVDVVDEGKALRVSAELPGLEDKDITLTIQEGSLTIKGEKRTDASKEEDGCYRTERAYGFFQRVVPLPSDVLGDRAEAEFKQGVLTVRIPKSESAQQAAKKIPIKAS